MTSWANTTKNSSSFSNQSKATSDFFFLIDDTFSFLIDDTYKLVIESGVSTSWTNTNKS